MTTIAPAFAFTNPWRCASANESDSAFSATFCTSMSTVSLMSRPGTGSRLSSTARTRPLASTSRRW